MPIRHNNMLLHHRQLSQVTGTTADGIQGATTAADANGVETATGLAIDTTGVTQSLPTAATFAPLMSATVTSIITPSSISSASPSSSTSSPTTDASASKEPSTSTVVAACAASGAALLLIVLFAMWYNRRLSSLPPRSGNQGGDETDRRSQPWARLGDDGDTWEGRSTQFNPPQVPAPAYLSMTEKDGVDATSGKTGGEKLGTSSLFKKRSNSMRSDKTGFTFAAMASTEMHEFNAADMPFSKYHPDLAKEMATTGGADGAAATRPFMGRYDTADGTFSWGGSTLGDQSFLSLRDSAVPVNHSTSNPNVSMAVSPTNSITVSHSTPIVHGGAAVLHEGQAGVIGHFGGEDDEDNNSANPFADPAPAVPVPVAQAVPVERRRSGSNPFFGASTYRARNSSSHNPFSDAAAPPPVITMNRVDPVSSVPLVPVVPPFGHAPSDSTTSTGSGDRALQSIIAALDGANTPDLLSNPRHPSMMSELTYLSTHEDSMSMAEFPLPPSTATTERGGYYHSS